MFYFTSIVIEKSKEIPATPGDRYDILYARDFNPNSFSYLTYARNVKKEIIPALLIELSKLYFRQLNPEKENSGKQSQEIHLNGSASSYQCSNCLTVYDKKYGDSVSNIPPGIPFDKLPESYKCHVCDSPKKYFVPVVEY